MVLSCFCFDGAVIFFFFVLLKYYLAKLYVSGIACYVGFVMCQRHV